MKAKLVVIANKGSVCSMGIGDKYKGGGGGGQGEGAKNVMCLYDWIRYSNEKLMLS